MKNKLLEIKLIGKSVADILDILPAVADEIENSGGLTEYTSGFTAKSGRDVSFSWCVENTDMGDVYDNPIEDQTGEK